MLFALLMALGILALPFLVGALVVAAFVFWIWMLIDAIVNQRLSGGERIAWVVLIWFTHWIGGLFYLCLARNRHRSSARSTPLAV